MDKTTTKKPKYIKGYWRDKPEAKQPEHIALPALVLFGSAFVALAVEFWQVTMLLIAAGLAAYLVRIRLQRRATEPRINDYANRGRRLAIPFI